jgi:hypothetical protein
VIVVLQKVSNFSAIPVSCSGVASIEVIKAVAMVKNSTTFKKMF